MLEIFSKKKKDSVSLFLSLSLSIFLSLSFSLVLSLNYDVKIIIASLDYGILSWSNNYKSIN